MPSGGATSVVVAGEMGVLAITWRAGVTAPIGVFAAIEPFVAPLVRAGVPWFCWGMGVVPGADDAGPRLQAGACWGALEASANV